MEEREEMLQEEGESFLQVSINSIFVSKIFAVLVLMQKYNIVTWFDWSDCVNISNNVIFLH